MSRSMGLEVALAAAPAFAVILNVRTTAVVRIDMQSHVGRSAARAGHEVAREMGSGDRGISGTFFFETGRLTSATCCSASAGGSEILR
ncbi:hypothetical protein [Promicromonospora sp. NFX87]|uniref:hypothetical protein n=1 Tax=Promicromonospora sp. NFX87 TaxID=3402691 RepID=UPI003AFB70FB